jgi:hypothetical protein
VSTHSARSGAQIVVSGEVRSVAVSAGSTALAIVEPSRIVVATLPDIAFVCEIGVDPDAAASEAAFVGADRLLVLSRYAAHSTAYLIDRSGPSKLAEIRVESPVRLLASSGEHVLARIAAGAASTAVIAAPDGRLDIARLPLRSEPSCAAGLGDGRFLVSLPGAFEEWDGASRTPLRRFKLSRPQAIQTVGVSAHHLWWIASTDPTRIEVLPTTQRGQARAHVVPEPIATAVGQVETGAVLAVGADTRRVYVVDVTGGAGPLPITTGAADAVALAVSRQTVAVVVARGRVPELVAVHTQLRPTLVGIALEPSDVREKPPARKNTADAGQASDAAGSAAAADPTRAAEYAEATLPTATEDATRAAETAALMRGAGTAEATREAGTAEATREAGTAETTREAGTAETTREAGTAETTREAGTAETTRATGTAETTRATGTAETTRATGTAETTRATKTGDAKGTAAGMEATRVADSAEADATGPPPAAAEPPASPAVARRLLEWRDRMRSAMRPVLQRGPLRPASAPTWRDDLAMWGRSVASGLHRDPPPPLPDLAGRLFARLNVPDELAPAIALAYAAHLSGTRGVAPADLAALLGHRWDDALGRGVLAAAGVLRLRGSRLVLAGPVTAFLDERPPVTGIVVGEPDGELAPTEATAVVAPSWSLELIAGRCAALAGAVLVPRAQAATAAVRLEARVRGAVPLVEGDAGERWRELEIALVRVASEAGANAFGLPVLATFADA